MFSWNIEVRQKKLRGYFFATKNVFTDFRKNGITLLLLFLLSEQSPLFLNFKWGGGISDLNQPTNNPYKGGNEEKARTICHFLGFCFLSHFSVKNVEIRNMDRGAGCCRCRCCCLCRCHVKTIYGAENLSEQMNKTPETGLSWWHKQWQILKIIYLWL